MAISTPGTALARCYDLIMKHYVAGCPCTIIISLILLPYSGALVDNYLAI